MRVGRQGPFGGSVSSTAWCRSARVGESAVLRQFILAAGLLPLPVLASSQRA
jgi:hypothetical protein